MKTASFAIVLLAIIAGGILFSSCRKIKMGKCCDKDAAYFFENDSSSIFLPNIFTPNGDGVNDIWLGYSKGVQSYHLAVNKNNLFKTKVFESTDVTTGWDGTYRGKFASEGVYQYSVEVTLQSGQQYTYEGMVCLVRKEFNSENCSECKYGSHDIVLCHSK